MVTTELAPRDAIDAIVPVLYSRSKLRYYHIWYVTKKSNYCLLFLMVSYNLTRLLIVTP